MWRCQPGRRGATDASRSTLVKRSGVLATRSLHEDVRAEQHERHDDQQEPRRRLRNSRVTPLGGRRRRDGGGRAAHVMHRSARRPRSDRRPATNLTMSSSQSRSVRARDARRRRRESPGRSIRGAHAPRPRSDSAARRHWSARAAGGRSRGRRTRRCRSRAARARADRRSATATTWWWNARRRIGVAQSSASRKSEITTICPRRGVMRSSSRSAAATLTVRRERLFTPRSRRRASTSDAKSDERVVDDGPMRVTRSPPATSMPKRLPWRAVRKPNAAAAENARSRFSHNAVPKSMLGERSTTSHVCSSRSASVVRTCGVNERAVRFQSMRRASSPTSYVPRAGGLDAGPGPQTEELAAQQAVEPDRDLELEPAELRGLGRDRRDAVGRRGWLVRSRRFLEPRSARRRGLRRDARRPGAA